MCIVLCGCWCVLLWWGLCLLSCVVVGVGYCVSGYVYCVVWLLVCGIVGRGHLS